MENKILIAQIAPSVRVAIGEEFGLESGVVTTGKIIAGLKKLGFDYVFDTQFSADVTIVEEANELIERIKNKGVLPMFTSCCPAWVYFMEHTFPELTPHLSSCKSPQQMLGALVKAYFAKKMNIDPNNIYHVSIMPCLVKKDEAARPEMKQNVDAVLSTRELAQLFKEEKIDFNSLPTEQFDSPLGESTGAATIFGVTGGVMEAALRTAYEKLTGKPLEQIDFEQVRGMQGTRKAAIQIGDLELKVAVVNGMFQARLLIDEIKKGTSPYHFIEVMNCQGGCIGGSGQPKPIDPQKRLKRIQGLYENDKNQKIRKSHENPAVIKLYSEGFDSHSLHTSYKLNK